MCHALRSESQVKGVVKDAASNVPDPSEAVDKVHYTAQLGLLIPRCMTEP